MSDMNDKGAKNRVDGAVTEGKGRVRSAAAELTGDMSQQWKGKGEQLKGKAQQALGKVEQKLAPKPKR